MFNPRRIVIQRYIGELTKNFERVFGEGHCEHLNALKWAAYMALEKSAQSDCLYHNLDNSIMTTAVGQDILLGKRMRGESVSKDDWLCYTVSLLCFALGYVRGACDGDSAAGYVVGLGGELMQVPRGATGAALARWVPERSQLIVRKHFTDHHILDIETVCSNIEMTRFPPPEGPTIAADDSYAVLTRAAHFIGAIADPHYMRKLNALFLEWEENDLAGELGFDSAVAMRDGYAELYRDLVAPYIGSGVAYLRETREGNRWVANMKSHLHAELHNEQSLGISRRRS